MGIGICTLHKGWKKKTLIYAVKEKKSPQCVMWDTEGPMYWQATALREGGGLLATTLGLRFTHISNN